MAWFDARERRALMLFLPLILLLVVGTMLLDSRRTAHRVALLQEAEIPIQRDSCRLFLFDPNTITYDSLLLLGFEKSQALNLLKYREAGKVYRLPEELDLLYGMTDSLFQRIRPYIRIGESFAYPPTLTRERSRFPEPAPRKFRPDGPFRIDTVSARYLQQLGFSIRWSEAFVDCYRRRGIRSLDEMRELRFIGDSITRMLAPYLLFPTPEADPFDTPVEINQADSAQLIAIYGIGEKSAREILRYRQRLGGFYRVEQLSEVKGVMEANYEKILQQIWCDSFQIQKIDINFAPAERLRVHPYMTSAIIRKLINRRQQRKSKGGWSTVEELKEEDILTDEEAERLRPYLRFGTTPEE